MKNKEKRKLTKAEEVRLEKFEALKENLKEKGYTEQPLTIGVIYANIMSIVLVLIPAALYIVLFLTLSNVSGKTTLDYLWNGSYFGIFIALFVLIIVHELIHGICYAICNKKGFKAVSFGFIVKFLTPYCTCSEPVTKPQYFFCALMPTVILSVIPFIVSVFTGSVFLFYISIAMLFGGGGDIMISLKLLKFKHSGKEAIYIDHPTNIGLTAFVK